MPPLDTESQFKFLISCIKHSSSGKVLLFPSWFSLKKDPGLMKCQQVDFVAVAKELDIVSKAAA